MLLARHASPYALEIESVLAGPGGQLLQWVRVPNQLVVTVQVEHQ